MPATHSRIAENYHAVLKRLESACARSGRQIDAVTLIAVTKYARMEWVRSLIRLGVRDLGESRPQQLEERVPLVAEPVRWHLIGHLQRNKVRRVLPLVDTIQSVDSLRLLMRIEKTAAELSMRPRLLLEVNVAGEPSKDGFSPHELATHWNEVLSCKNVAVHGLMTMAPRAADAESTRPVFRHLRELRDRLVSVSPESIRLTELSMGMSRDFDVAIEEQATMIRIGSELFAGLNA